MSETRTISRAQAELASLRADKARLDFLDSLLGTYTGRVVCRMSDRGRGFRLHETAREDGKSTNVRDAIDHLMIAQASCSWCGAERDEPHHGDCPANGDDAEAYAERLRDAGI